MESIINFISLTMGASWASGINLYATILVLGIAQNTGGISLPEQLKILSNPIILVAAGIMYAVEFFADKIPGVDTTWDAIHTFIRIPAGALIAYSSVGDVGEPFAIAAAIIGGSLTAGTHTMKSGTRLMINTSPEPITNIGTSIGEDVAVFSGLWLAFNHPAIFSIALVIFILFMIWFIPKIWKIIKKGTSWILKLFGVKSKEFEKVGVESDIENKLKRLSELHIKGIITGEEYERKRKEILDKF